MAFIERTISRHEIENCNPKEFLSSMVYGGFRDHADLHRAVEVQQEVNFYDLTVNFKLKTDVEMKCDPDVDW